MAYMHHMVDMEQDDDDVLDHIAVNPVLNNKYPYHLRIALTDAEFEKLDLDPMEAKKDGVVHGHFIGTITDVCHKDGETGKHCRVEIQIEKLGLESEDEENENEDEENEDDRHYAE